MLTGAILYIYTATAVSFIDSRQKGLSIYTWKFLAVFGYDAVLLYILYNSTYIYIFARGTLLLIGVRGWLYRYIYDTRFFFSSLFHSPEREREQTLFACSVLRKIVDCTNRLSTNARYILGKYAAESVVSCAKAIRECRVPRIIREGRGGRRERALITVALCPH